MSASVCFHTSPMVAVRPICGTVGQNSTRDSHFGIFTRGKPQSVRDLPFSRHGLRLASNLKSNGNLGFGHSHEHALCPR